MKRIWKILRVIGLLIVALSGLLLSAYLESKAKYGKKIEEDKRKFDRLSEDLRKLNEATKGITLTADDAARIYSIDLVKETRDKIEEVYAGMDGAEGKMLSMGTYFLTYHKAGELKEQLGSFEKFVSDSLQTDSMFRHGILNLSDRKRNSEMVGWEHYYFENVTKDSAASYLRQMKIGVVKAEIALMKRATAR